MRVSYLLVLVSLCAVPASFTLLETAIAFREPIRYEEFKYIIKDYIANDAQTKLVASLLKTSQYIAFYRKLLATTEFVNLVNYLHQTGIIILELVNKIHTFMGIPAFVPKKTKSMFMLLFGQNGYLSVYFFSDIPKYTPTTGLEGVLFKILKLYPAKATKTFIDTVKFAEVEKILVKQSASDPKLAAELKSLWNELNTIPELKVIFIFMQNNGGLPFLKWLNSKATLYGIPKFTQTTWTCEYFILLIHVHFRSQIFLFSHPHRWSHGSVKRHYRIRNTTTARTHRIRYQRPSQ
jgi:Insect allergen related repeat, nitrile-specifier detoxification